MQANPGRGQPEPGWQRRETGAAIRGLSPEELSAITSYSVERNSKVAEDFLTDDVKPRLMSWDVEEDVEQRLLKEHAE